MEELVRYMRALIMLQIHAPQAANTSAGNTSAVKPEVLLARAGFPHKEIADMMGKTQGAVAKTISRAKTGRPDENGPEAEGLADG